MIRRLGFVLALAACGGESTPPDDGSCTGECRVTALTAQFADTTRVLERAVFGIAETGDLQVEAYLGGRPACPVGPNNSPDYALVLTNVAMLDSSAPTVTSGHVLDFAGDLLAGEVSTLADLVVVHTEAVDLEHFVALDVHLEFAGGTLDGHLFAEYCREFFTPL